jgi:uncharacterized protein
MTYRILSLDGGGAWALIEVRALIELFGEGATGHDVLSRFDLAAANSGGSLVLAGLLENKTLGDVLALFKTEQNRRAIFSPTKSIADQALQSLTGLGPKYSADAKLPALERLLPKTGDTKLSDVAAKIIGTGGKPIHVLIIAFDYDRNRAAFFRSATIDNHNGYGDAADITLAAAVHASTNAPVNYFDAPATIVGCPDRYWDGGITGNNNPVLAACVEASSMGQAPSDFRVLSLGTASVRLPLAGQGAPASPFYAPRQDSNLRRDLTKLATSILDDPPDFATFAVHMMTGGGSGLPNGVASRIVRLNPLISPVSSGGNWTVPNGWTAAQFQYLCQIDMDAVTDVEVAYIDDWCGYWIAGKAPNQPIRMDGQTFEPEVGPGRFADAKKAWINLVGPVNAPGGAPVA